MTLTIRTPSNNEVDTFFMMIDHLRSPKKVLILAQARDQKPGQVVFNEIYQAVPDIANRLRGSMLDPFHRDERIEFFLDQVVEMYVDLACCQTVSEVAMILR